jgi:hypothetical protein
MNEQDAGLRGPLALMMASFVGLALAVLGGPAGAIAAVWNAVMLVLAWRKAMSRRAVADGAFDWHGAIGSFGSLGLAALYALAARALFGGSDPEDVDQLASLQLDLVAIGCVVVGVTSAAVWLARGSRRRRR